MSCLFESLSRFVNTQPGDLRRIICVYLSTNPKLAGIDAYECVENQPDIITGNGDLLKTYVNEMSKSHVMGGAIEIMAFCQLYKKNVKVEVIHKHVKPIEFISCDSYPWVVVTWNGGHYEPK